MVNETTVHQLATHRRLAALEQIRATVEANGGDPAEIVESGQFKWVSPNKGVAAVAWGLKHAECAEKGER
jgi:hypothetical protein